MNAPTDIQMINGPDGKPAFVVMPYADFVRTYGQGRDLIPHEVVSATVQGATPARAWREYLKLTQAEVAARLEISQPSYAKQEGSEKLRVATVGKIAKALGITIEQLDF
jgi:DNA-binding XRE family transcriptional regulator